MREATITDQREQTPYVIRMQAIGRSGPGIISPSIELVTGLKHIPLAVSIRILEPAVRPDEKETGTLLEPGQPVRFQCIADGRPQPSVSWSWVPLSNTSTGPAHLAMEPDPAQAHRYQSAPTEASTWKGRTLQCEARNEQGHVQDGHAFRVLRPGGPVSCGHQGNSIHRIAFFAFAFFKMNALLFFSNNCSEFQSQWNSARWWTWTIR